MDPPKPGAGAAAAHERDSKPQPAYPPPVTGIPMGQASQYHSHQNQQRPLHIHQQQHHEHRQRTSWSSGLCDCCSDVPNCCLTFWCPCITFGRIAEIVDKGTPSCAVSGAIFGLLMWFTCLSCLYSCLYRSKLRNQYMLEESPCNDCVVHCCCETCALCQEYRELEHSGYGPATGWQENLQGPRCTAASSALVVEQGMTR